MDPRLLRPKFDCRVCGSDQVDTPMLRNELWLQVSPRDETVAYLAEQKKLGFRARDLICIPCTEKRLGRRILLADLRPGSWTRSIQHIHQNELQQAKDDALANQFRQLDR